MKRQQLGTVPNAIDIALLVDPNHHVTAANTYAPAVTYARLLTTKRPANTEGEATARQYLIRALSDLGVAVTVDAKHNLIVDTRNGTSNVLFSAHYDSAHRGVPVDGNYTNKVAITPEGNLCGVDACIGADDASGIYVMLRMIQHGVPALYIFHQGEEVGGLGSYHIAEKTPELLDGITHAIAFDRYGTRDVVWMQGGEDCASEGCAGVIAHTLNQLNPAFAYAPSDMGSFTDTKVYRSLVPECFNISVGYDNEHTASETQDVKHLLALAEACCVFPWHTLPVWRDPITARYDDRWDAWGYSPYSSWAERHDWLNDRTFGKPDRIYDSWEDWLAEDFDEALDRAYELVKQSEVYMVDALYSTLDDEFDLAATQLCNHLNKHYPLGQTT